MNKIKSYLFLSFVFASKVLFSQTAYTINIDSCYVKALQNYPLVKQFQLIEKSKEYSLQNANKAYLPVLNIAGQITYQSAVTELPIKIPNVNIESASKDQYKIYGEVIQPITNLFLIKDQKALLKSGAEIETQKLEVELYNIKSRVEQIYFGILLIDAQINQIELLKKDINLGITKIEAAIANGVALKSNESLLKAELLKANQKTIALKATKTGFIEMLSLFINETLDENTILETPAAKNISNTINRPELKMFDLQKNIISVQEKLILNKNLPQFNLYFQGGYGRPALNMLSNEFDPYYIGGLKLTWNLSGFYTYATEKKILKINENIAEVQEENFKYNINMALKSQYNEIKKLGELINSDQEIITIREDISSKAKKQLEYGVATTNDYILYLNAESQAKQDLEIHKIQLLIAQFNYNNTSGN